VQRVVDKTAVNRRQSRLQDCEAPGSAIRPSFPSEGLAFAVIDDVLAEQVKISLFGAATVIAS
jgi:hypothetical protein